MNARRAIHLAVLTLLCAWMYAARPGAVGLVSTQEAFRATAARHMQRSGDFLVPTLDGHTPYLTKSPMMYWVAVAIAEARGGEVGEVDVRLTSAFAGVAGVIALYFGAIVILRPRDDEPAPPETEDAAWWSALGLATGVLYVRSSRTAELDVLMVAPVIIAVAALARAWRAAGDTEQPLPFRAPFRPGPNVRTRAACVAIATLAGAFASLVKPVVPVIVIALAAYGSMVVSAALARVPTPRAWRAAAGVAGALGAGGLAAMACFNAREAPYVGAAVFALIGAVLAWTIVMALHPPRLRIWLTAWSRTHPLVVIPLALASYLIWIAAVHSRVGDDAIRQLAAVETGNNLNILVPRSPTKNIGFLAYGLLPIGAASIISALWLMRERPAVTPTQRIPYAWGALAFALFSTTTKGVARYLTPLWPALAMMGGLYLARSLRESPRDNAQAGAWRAGVTAAFIIVAFSQGVYYTIVRPAVEGDRSPRALTREVFSEHAVPPDRLATYGFKNGRSELLDFYADRTLPEWSPSLATPAGPWVILNEDRLDSFSAEIEQAGLAATTIPTRARWRPDDGPVRVVRLDPR